MIPKYSSPQIIIPLIQRNDFQLMLSTHSRAWVSLIMFLIQFLIPLMVTMFAYSLISYHLWGAGHIGAATQQQQLRRLASRRRTIKMLVLVVILFGVSWLPLNLYHLISDWSRQEHWRCINFTFIEFLGIPPSHYILPSRFSSGKLD